MKRKYAFLIDNKVVKIDFLSEEEYYSEIKKYDAIWDIEDEVFQPEIGWFVSGNKLIPPKVENGEISWNILEEKIMEYRLRHGNRIADKAIVALSARNRLLNKTSQQVISLISDLYPIEMAIRKCALPTALYLIRQFKPSYPEYQDIFESVESEILNVLENESKS